MTGGLQDLQNRGLGLNWVLFGQDYRIYGIVTIVILSILKILFILSNY